MQLAEIVFPAFGIGEGGLRLLVAGVTLGFLPAVVLAWIYDITKEGIRRTGDGPGSSTPYRLTLLMFALTTIGLTGTVGWYLFSQGVFEVSFMPFKAFPYFPRLYPICLYFSDFPNRMLDLLLTSLDYLLGIFEGVATSLKGHTLCQVSHP